MKQTNSKFKIVRNIPIPKMPFRKYPFQSMKIGDSFFAIDESNTVRTSAGYFSRKNKEYKFTVRKEGDGLRVWRIPVNKQ